MSDKLKIFNTVMVGFCAIMMWLSLAKGVYVNLVILIPWFIVLVVPVIYFEVKKRNNSAYGLEIMLLKDVKPGSFFFVLHENILHKYQKLICYNPENRSEAAVCFDLDGSRAIAINNSLEQQDFEVLVET